MEECSDKIKRIIDADLNRAREGLRVVEDIARFIFDSQDITKSIKDMRSEIAYIQKKHRDFLLNRDTELDVGTALTSEMEKNRDSIEDILTANMKRVEESLRVLEEMFKAIDKEASLLFKKLRYKSYTIEKNLIQRIEDKP